jgi:hypothetical protein
MKHSDLHAVKRNHFVVIIRADVGTRRIIGIGPHVGGTGPSKPGPTS